MFRSSVPASSHRADPVVVSSEPDPAPARSRSRTSPRPAVVWHVALWSAVVAGGASVVFACIDGSSSTTLAVDGAPVAPRPAAAANVDAVSVGAGTALPVPAELAVAARVDLPVEFPVEFPVVVRAEAAPTSSTAPTSRLQAHALPDGARDRVDHRGAGEAALRAGHVDDAVVSFRKALAVDASAAAWAALGDAYLRSGRTDAGIECLEEAVALDVDDAAARRLLVRQYLARDDGRRARLHAEEWVRLSPQDPAARQGLGRAFSQLGMWRQAIEQFALVVAVQPDNAWAHNNLGYAALQIGDTGAAIEHLERALEGKPQQAFMFNNLGVAYEREGELAFAHAAFSRAAELNPKYAQAALNRDRIQAILDETTRVAAAAQLVRYRDEGARAAATLDEAAAGVALPAMPALRGE